MATRRIGNININYTVPEAQTQIYNAIGRDTGEQTTGTGDNFFTKRAKSIGNAVGTTGAALYETGGNLIGAAIAGLTGGNYTSHRSKIENEKTEKARQDARESMNNVARKYGYNTYQDVWDAREAALKAGDQELLDKIDNVISPELQAQSGAGDNSLSERSAEYDDYRNNNFVSKQINQDPGKFAGSAINTLSTGLDLTGITAGPLGNAIQGGVEGFADELEQNGLQNFDWSRAGQNALVGAATGAVTGALNKGISNKLAKNGGNLFKGGNALTSGINKLGSKTALGRIGSTLATGAARGAISGAVGGATGAGLSSALQGADLGTGISNALQGAVQGAGQGAVTGGIMAGANMAISKTPGIGKFYNDLQTSKQRWDQSGSNFNERLTNTLNSGDSGIGNWLNKRTQSKVLNAAGRLGNSIRDVNDRRLDLSGEQSENDANMRGKEGLNKKLITLLGAEKLEGNSDRFKFSDTKPDFKNTLDNEYYKHGYLGDNPTADEVNSYNAAADFVKNTIFGNMTNDEVINLYSKLPTNVQDDVYKMGLQYYNNDFKNVLSTVKDPYPVLLHSAQAGNLDISEVPDQYKQQLINDVSSLRIRQMAQEYSNETDGRIDPDEFIDFYESTKDVPNTDVQGMAEAYEMETDGRVSADELLDFVRQQNGAKVQTPTTAKGWLKKAGQRIVEDVNNRGVGLSIKDVGDDQNYSDAYNSGMDQGLSGGELGDEIADFSGLPKNISGSDLYKLSQSDPDVRDAVNYVASELIDAGERPTYDQVANDYWDEVRAQYAQAQNYQGPGDYYESTSNETPETEVYRSLTGTNTTSAWDRVAQEAGYATYDDAINAFVQANPNAKVSAGSVLSWLDNNPLTAEAQDMALPTTTRESKMKYAQGKELLAQYGSVDQPMARATKAAETFQELAEMGFTKPEDVERISNAVTGSNGAVSALNKSIIASAKPVNTYEGKTSGQTIDQFIDDSIEHNMLSGTNGGKAVKRGINAYLRSLPSHTEGSVTFEDSAADAFKVVQGLEARAAELEGRGGSTYHRATTEDVHQAAVLKDVANLLKDRIYSGADVETALTPTVANNLKALAPDNTSWAETVDDFMTTAKSPKDIRTFQKPFVRASRYIDNQYVQAATAGGRMASSAGELPSILPTTKAGIIKQVVNNIWNSNTAHRARANLYGKLANKAANNAANNATNTTVDSTTAPTAEPTAPAAGYNPTTVNPQTQIYNAIGRTEGAINAEEARAAQYLTDAAQNLSAESGYAAPLGVSTTTGSLEDLAATSTPTTSTSVYNTLSGNQSSGSYFPTSGDYWTDLLGTALSLALDADDAEAFGSLYTMYQNALANQESTTTSATKLTDKQRQANAAALALEDFAQAESNFAYDVSDIPVLGTIANLGGNDYQSKAEALALQVGYMLSGATVNKEEAKKIGMAYVPQPRDNATVRQNKINQLRGIISEYQRTDAE